MSIETKNSPYFQLCGFNSGQHSKLKISHKTFIHLFLVYFDVEDVKELNVVMNLTKDDFGRMWEIKVSMRRAVV